MRSRGSPISSARCADSSADWIIASRVTSRASFGIVRARVLVHQMREQFLVERAPVGADAHRLAVLDRDLDDGAELAVLLVLEADIAGIDAVLVERLGAGRMIGEQLVADVVEVADDRHRRSPACSSRSLMCGTAAAASSRSTVMRTISEPARASAATCADGARRHRRCRCWSSTARPPARRRRRSRRRHRPAPTCVAPADLLRSFLSPSRRSGARAPGGVNVRLKPWH